MAETKTAGAAARLPPVLWTLVLPIGLVLAYWWFEALIGFNPTDDGFVLAQSWRLLQGQTIHVDFTSPRPLGSAFLHLPDVLSGWATLAISRLIVVLQQLWIASATVALLDVFRRLRPVQRLLLIVVAFALNTSVWPVMAWHTIDGIFLGITALWLAQRASVDPVPTSTPRPWQRSDVLIGVAWLLAGAAPLVKQGFLVVPLLVGLLFLMARRWRALLWAPLLVVPGLAYLAAARWQLEVVTGQIYGGSGAEVSTPLIALLNVAGDPMGLGTIVVAVLACWVASSDRAGAIRRTSAAVLVMAPTVVVGAHESFAMAGVAWPYLAAITLLVVAVWLIGWWAELASAVVLLGLGFATTASWGVPNPSLFSGSLVAAAGGFVLVGRREQRRAGATAAPDLRATAMLLTGAVLVVAVVLQARSLNIYREGPQANLTVGSDVPGLAGIRMSGQSARFVGSVEQCVDRTGARTVAVIPDGPAIYPLLRLESPFDVDWWLPVELPPDIRARTVADIARLNDETGWLVLFQGYDLATLAQVPLDQVDRPTGQRVTLDGEVSSVFDALAGQPIICGSLSGEYRPD